MKARGLPSDFPLTPHRSGQWRVRINGRDYYFGSLDDPRAARKLYEYEAAYIERGLPIPTQGMADRQTVGGVLDRWIEYQRGRHAAGEIAAKTFDDYRRVADFMRASLGEGVAVASLIPTAWQAYRKAITNLTDSPTVQTRYVVISRMPWRWAWESAIIDSAVRFGPSFKIARKAAVRATRHAKQQRTYTPAQVRTLIDAASQPMRAMLLLGINCGMTQAEVSGLRWADVDLPGKFIDTLRAKTGAKRQAVLWPETAKALAELPRVDGRANVFTTRHGGDYVRQTINAAGELVARDNISREFSKLARAAGLKLPRGLGFGKLRATYRTAVDGCGDVNAVRLTMGHELGKGAEAHYIGDMPRARLAAVSRAARAWMKLRR